jgi:uncharacterized membrane-anchored protein
MLRRDWFLCLLLFLISALATFGQTEPDQGPPPIAWEKGPMTGNLGSIAEIQVPEGFLFTDKKGAQKLLELTHNQTSGSEVGAIVPAGEESYFLIFEFDDVGYIKDDDKDKIDADGLLKGMTEGTEEANEYRKEQGWPELHVVGWETPPFYDPATHNLTWAVRIRSPRGDSINYSTRILGRHGAMKVDLVVSPNEYQQVIPAYNSLISGYNFSSGNKYAEFVKGDKLAGYGLTALIAGGAGAAAVKTGLFAKFWKVIVVFFAKAWKLVAVAIAGLAALLKKIFGKSQPEPAGDIVPPPLP